jgi:predicted nucleic acid-binding protein
VEIMFLVDTNILLEILLKQGKRKKCRKFLDDNIGNIHITDFALHSIGLILFRYNKEDSFKKFVGDFMPHARILSLPPELYGDIVDIRKNLNLDFDDAYQYMIAKYYELKIVTMDKDFEKVKDGNILFL